MSSFSDSAKTTNGFEEEEEDEDEANLPAFDHTLERAKLSAGQIFSWHRDGAGTRRRGRLRYMGERLRCNGTT